MKKMTVKVVDLAMAIVMVAILAVAGVPSGLMYIKTAHATTCLKCSDICNPGSYQCALTSCNGQGYVCFGPAPQPQ